MAVIAVEGVRAWRHYAEFQAQGWASGSSFLPAWLTLPGALPAYVVGSLSGSVLVALAGYVLGMVVVYGGVGYLIDVAARVARRLTTAG
jgi:hypothetical protein